MKLDELWKEIVTVAMRLQYADRTGDPDITSLLDDGEHLAQLVVTYEDCKKLVASVEELKKEAPRG